MKTQDDSKSGTVPMQAEEAKPSAMNVRHPLIAEACVNYSDPAALLVVFDQLDKHWPGHYSYTVEGFKAFVGDIRQCAESDKGGIQA